MSIHRHQLFSLSTASVLALAIASPAVAQQMTAKDAWSRLREAASGAGLSMTSQSVSDFGTSIAVNGLRIFPTAEPNSVIVSMDSLRIEPRGDMVAVIPSELVSVQTLVDGGIARNFEIRHDGEIMGNMSETGVALDLDFATLTARLVSATQRGRPMDEAVMLNLTGFGASLRAAIEGNVDVNIGAAGVGYEFRVTDPTGSLGGPQTGSGSMQGARMEFAATELDTLDNARTLRDAMESGVTMRLSFSAGPSEGASSQVINGAPLTISSSAVDGGLTLAFVDGRLEGSLYSGAGSIEGGMGPMSGTITHDGLGLDVLVPLVTTPDDQALRYAFRFRNFMPSPELVTMLGGAPFAGDSVSLALDLGASGRLVREIPIDGTEMDNEESPFDLSELRLDDLLIRVGDSEFTGAGAVTLIGGLLANIGRDMPEATGDLTFNLVGGERFLTRLQALNMLPNDQLFFVRMMLNGLGRPVGDDHLQSDMAIRPGGVITVNGSPLPF